MKLAIAIDSDKIGACNMDNSTGDTYNESGKIENGNNFVIVC